MLRSEQYWDKPQQFNPDRFLNNGKYYVPTKAFIPFGQGTRKCPGEKFAMTSLFIIFIKLIQQTLKLNIELKTLF